MGSSCQIRLAFTWPAAPNSAIDASTPTNSAKSQPPTTASLKCAALRPRPAQGRLARHHGDIETNNTTAHPQQGAIETGITSAPENCTKNTDFSPAKAMAVSVEARPAPAKAMAVSTPHRYKRAKATGVSDNRATWSTGLAAVPVGGGGAWPGFETTRRATDQRQAPPVWRALKRLVGLAAVPEGGGRARAGLEIDHSEPQARVWRSRGRPGPTAPTTRGTTGNKNPGT